ncbi:MAG: flagellar protein [Negativicutes bacterium]|nr:flagellar protein [Negativicutes bacterium]
MSLKNCPECGKVYLDNPAEMCPDCYRREEEDADKVAEFLREHPRSHIDEVHQATGVKHKIILRMIRKGRIVGDVNIVYPCESCGRPIAEGRVCEECGRKILSQIKPAEKPAPEKREDQAKKNSGMFTTKF